MGPSKDGTNAAGPRRVWEPPAVTQLAIAAETKSFQPSVEGVGSLEPQPPTSPAAKLGFSFEMALPLAARSDS
jgi:hypothetical protein